jgi:hypothetical protein
MTGIRFEQRVSFPLLALHARKSGALTLSFKLEQHGASRTLCVVTWSDREKKSSRRTMMNDEVRRNKSA